MKKKELSPETEGKTVWGEGPPDARIVLIGQNPGEEEAKQGRPFVGRTGKYLDRVLEKYNIPRGKLFITSVVKRKTPKNRKPTAKEIKYWLPYLIEEIKRSKPELIVLMGEVAWQTPRFDGIKYIETYHPTAAMRFPKARVKFETDFQKLKEQID